MLHWPIGIVRPSCSTGAKGEPLATSACPSVQRIRSSPVASLWLVGFESGKMIGRSTWLAMSRTISSVNAPCTVERPIMIVGCTCADDLRELELAGARARPVGDVGRGLRVDRLIGLQIRAAVVQQAVLVDDPEPAARLLLAEAVGDERGAQVAGHADPRRAGAEEDDALILQRRTRDADRADDRAERHRRGALDVVVERQQVVAVASRGSGARACSRSPPTGGTLREAPP